MRRPEAERSKQSASNPLQLALQIWQKEWPVIRSAKISFFTCAGILVAFCALVIWKGEERHYSRIISEMQAAIAQKDATIQALQSKHVLINESPLSVPIHGIPNTPLQQTFNVTSNKQQGGITAGIVNNGPQRRIISAEQKETIISFIKNSHEIQSEDSKINIVAIAGDAEAAEFAAKIYDILKESGLKIDCPYPGTEIPLGPVRGIILQVKSSNGPSLAGMIRLLSERRA